MACRAASESEADAARVQLRLGVAALVLGAWLAGCSHDVPERSSADEDVPTPVARAGDALPALPDPPEEERGTSVHPTDAPAVPPPLWARQEAYVEERDGRRVVVASGSAGDAGNHPDTALRNAASEARAKLSKWFEKNNEEDARQDRARAVENRIHTDGKAYVRLEAELP